MICILNIYKVIKKIKSLRCNFMNNNKINKYIDFLNNYTSDFIFITSYDCKSKTI